MDKLLTTRQAAEVLSVNQDTIQRYVKNGQLKAIKLNGRYLRIIPSSLQDFISASEYNPSEIVNKIPVNSKSDKQ